MDDALPFRPVADTVTQTPTITPPSRGVRFAGLTGLVFAILQSACTAVLAVSGIRVAIGLTALAAASGVYGPARGFHQDAIRIPMLILGTLGALINLAVLTQIWRLRKRESGNWRRRTVSRKEIHSEWWQFALAVVTLLLVATETVTHSRMHKAHAPAQIHSRP